MQCPIFCAIQEAGDQLCLLHMFHLQCKGKYPQGYFSLQQGFCITITYMYMYIVYLISNKQYQTILSWFRVYLLEHCHQDLFDDGSYLLPDANIEHPPDSTPGVVVYFQNLWLYPCKRVLYIGIKFCILSLILYSWTSRNLTQRRAVLKLQMAMVSLIPLSSTIGSCSGFTNCLNAITNHSFAHWIICNVQKFA